MIIIILASFTILGIFLTLLCWCLKKDILTLIFLGIVIGLSISTFLVNMTLRPKPTAMDVYQNKTELEYTIRGGKVVDSVVVFKNK